MSPLVNKVPLCKACTFSYHDRERGGISSDLCNPHTSSLSARFPLCKMNVLETVSPFSVIFYILALCSVTSQYFDVMSSMSGFFLFSVCPPVPSLPSAHYPCDILMVLHVVLFRTGDPDHHMRERVVQLLQVLHRYCSVKWSCMGHHSLSFSASCGYSLWRCVISIDTTGHSTALPSSSWVDSCQRKGFSLWRR